MTIKRLPAHFVTAAGWKRHVCIAVAVLAVQFVVVAYQFPFGELFTQTPILHIDNGFQWYQVELAVDLWRQHKLTGYDPTFGAGQMGGLVVNGSGRIPAALAISLDSAVSPVVAYKIYVFLAELIAPLAVVLAARLAGVGFMHSAVASGLGVLLWWASYLHWYHTAGMVSFVLASFLALPYAIAVANHVRAPRPRIRNGIALGALGGLGLLLHPHFPVVMLLLLLPLIWPDLAPKSLARTVGRGLPIAIFAGIVNLPWLLAIAAYPPDYIGGHPYQKTVDITLIPRNLVGMFGDGAQGAKINVALAIGAACAAILRSQYRPLAMALVIGWSLMSLIGAVGAVLEPLAVIQPNRLLPAAYVALLLPASIGLVELAQRLAGRPVFKPRLGWPVAAIVAASLALATIEVGREVTPGPHGRYGDTPPEVDGVGPVTRWLLTWLETRTSSDARVLFETSHARVHDGSHIAGYLARTGGREFIGGPYPFTYAASAWDGVAFGRPIDGMSVEVFRHYLSVYNVGWLIVHSQALKSYLRGMPGITLAGTRSGINVYAVAVPTGRIIEGPGSVVEAALGRIAVTGLTGPRTVLSYHYVSGMAADDEKVSVVAVMVPGITEPMIGIVGSSPATVTITLP